MLIQATGLTHRVEGAFSEGYILIAPVWGQDAYLINKAGEIAHSWRTGPRMTSWCYMRPGGRLFINERSENARGVELSGSGIMREYDWDGNIVWEHIDPWQHHDARRLETGGVVYIAYREMAHAEQTRVKGGVAGSETERGMFGEVIREVDVDGNVVWEWDFANFGPGQFPLHDNANRWSAGHPNTIQILANGDYLICSKALNLIFRIDRQTSQVVWYFQDDEMGGPHDAQMMDNGNILVFANGTFGSDLLYSQVWEIDSKTKEIVWRYVAKTNPMSFFSPHISGCERLANGNTLICEGARGCVFETTPDRDVVWEYVSPFFADHALFNQVNWPFRARHATSDSAEIEGRLDGA
jgi:hypothetical protein